MTHSIKFYTDEMVPKAIIQGLRRRSIDVISTPEADMLGQKDDAHWKYAIANKRTLFTQDADFLALAAKTPGHPGLVYATKDKPLGKIIVGLIAIWESRTPAEMIDQVVHVGTKTRKETEP